MENLTDEQIRGFMVFIIFIFPLVFSAIVYGITDYISGKNRSKNKNRKK